MGEGILDLVEEGRRVGERPRERGKGGKEKKEEEQER
jgi:hypothetical protein